MVQKKCLEKWNVAIPSLFRVSRITRPSKYVEDARPSLVGQCSCFPSGRPMQRSLPWASNQEPSKASEIATDISNGGAFPIVHVATDRRWIVWSSAVSATRMNPHRPMTLERHFERKHRQTRQTCSRGALASVPIHGLAEPRATMREGVGVNVSSVICCSRAASLKQLVPEPCDQHRFIAGVSHRGLPRRHKVCPCSERTCTSWQGKDGVTESDCPTRMKARDRMAVDVAGSGLMRPF
ncbi:uncharacterized protein BDZ83DRAFT_262286 [Colletotrichum acutatum]|uniref:Uncharacterized protein n=1 Tax=Glomerella acutata TaxID=27357 RepID=A0AAD8UR38_GLOAC|nr:uncharacterized protein BDZ83DRAFT_262286 [Colletotrichum acutatum]KAK1726319.1 hypothetical protein BDZ83DRAFT_262286 [Colletotrichum acutatum]